MSTKSSDPSQLVPLSVLIVTHRSDHRFENCLRSVQFADEILIIDAKSDNDWASLANQYRFKVVRTQDQVTNFSQTRNWLIKQANHNWVLFIDSDEEISPALAEHIPDLISRKSTAGYFIRRQDYFHGKPLHYGEIGRVYKLRLAQSKRIKYQRPIHETAEVVGLTRRVNDPILHFSHESVAEFWSKIVLYATMEAKYRYEQGRRFHFWELFIFPPGKFAYNYFWKLGLLDGTRGLIYSVLMSFHSLIVRVRLYELEKNARS